MKFRNPETTDDASFYTGVGLPPELRSSEARRTRDEAREQNGGALSLSDNLRTFNPMLPDQQRISHKD